MGKILDNDSEALQIVSTKDRHRKPLTTVIDMETGIVRNDPIPDDETLAQFYSQDYRVNYKSASLPRPRQILRNFRRSHKLFKRFDDVFSKANSFLDAGAGSGEFLFAAKYLGKSAKGVEPNEDYSEYCRRELELDVDTAHLKEDLFENGDFDLILLSHVLEHLNDPVRYLTMLRNWLSDDGMLYIEVPDIDQMCLSNDKGNMFHFGHIFNYSPSTLRAVAGLAGLVEMEETLGRTENSTSVVFVKGEPLTEFPDNSVAAKHTHKLIQDHYAGINSPNKFAKVMRKAKTHINESKTSKRFERPIDIANAVMSGEVK